MALVKVTYVNGVTVITAENLNAIQDAIIALENAGIPTNVVQYVAQTLTDAQKAQARDNIGAVAVAQGVAHAGEFVVVGSDGNITTVTMSVWQGGSF